MSADVKPEKTREQRARELHDWFCKNTNQPLPLTMDRLMMWEQWLARGHNGHELAKVIRHLRREIDRGKRHSGALKFSNLIANVDRFEEDLCMVISLENQTRRPLTPLPDAVAAPVALAVQTARKVISDEDIPDLESRRKSAAAQLAALKASL